MAISLESLRDELFPGLMAIAGRYQPLMDSWEFTPEAPHIWVPKLELSLPPAVAVGAAAAIVQNPIVTRRLWMGWGK